MGKRTGIIKFNVKDRGRKFRGVDRNFDTVELAKLINGGDVQERVKHGDMLGFYGHWPRVKFGMNPIEGAVVGGKVIHLEPAVRTVYLKAYPDGTIEHEEEFLETNPGKLAERLHLSKSGGFSSAIDVRRVGPKQMPFGFYGFDFVLEPNFSTNRGYDPALDGVSDESLMLLDEVGAYNEIVETTNRLLDSVQSAYDMAMQTNQRLVEENEQLIAMLAAQKREKPALDGVLEVVRGCKQSRFDEAGEFLTARLSPIEEPKREAQKPDAADRFIDRYFR